MADDDLAAALAQIRENAERLTGSYPHKCKPGDSCTAHDALRMVGALDEVLKLADAWTDGWYRTFPPLEEDRAWVTEVCRAGVRTLISRALTGEADDDNGT